jgi:hypothetical protein
MFVAAARRFGIDWKTAAPHTNSDRLSTLQANFAAIVLNGLFFPTAGKILGAGLLLTWFLNELTPSAAVVGLLIPIQYGAALLAQPWIAQWMSKRPRRAPYYRNQALVRAVVWIALGVVVMTGRGHTGWLIGIFFAVVIVDAVAAGVGNIAFSDTLARVVLRRDGAQVIICRHEHDRRNLRGGILRRVSGGFSRLSWRGEGRTHVQRQR